MGVICRWFVQGEGVVFFPSRTYPEGAGQSRACAIWPGNPGGVPFAPGGKRLNRRGNRLRRGNPGGVPLVWPE